MQRPWVITHNSISLDGGINGFRLDLEVHYEVAATYGARIHLSGSVTALTGIEQFVPERYETAADRKKPNRAASEWRPWWAVVDSKGALEGKLHLLRSSKQCRDVVVLVSRETPDSYLRYLADRDYDFIATGGSHADLGEAIALLGARYDAPRILVDSGPILVGALLDRDLVDEVSLLIHPELTGSARRTLFESLEHPRHLGLGQHQMLEDGVVHTVYRRQHAAKEWVHDEYAGASAPA